jgi:uncharacterized membrane protein
MAAPDDKLRYPLWTYAVVGVAILLAVMWTIAAVIGFLVGLVKVVIVLVLAAALVAWVIGQKSERRR